MGELDSDLISRVRPKHPFDRSRTNLILSVLTRQSLEEQISLIRVSLLISCVSTSISYGLLMVNSSSVLSSSHSVVTDTNRNLRPEFVI